MNRIYKVIWNKTRGMYMVVSELAKGQSKDGRRAVGRKKVAQTAAALAVFFSIVSMGGTSFAADGTTKVEPAGTGSTTAQEVYTKEGTDKQIKAANQYTYRKVAAEEKAREEADTQLDTRITNVKEYLEGQHPVWSHCRRWCWRLLQQPHPVQRRQSCLLSALPDIPSHW